MTSIKSQLFCAHDRCNSRNGNSLLLCNWNHDLDLNVRSNEHARTTYKSYYGPTYYSFNRGNVHYVVLDDIFFIAKSYLYVGYLTEQQLQWLEQDLKQVTPDLQ